tara:strand:+ start:4211 stop:4687 length:477 start_codon:yes stop_codon:yes gene_type:complete
MSSVPFFLCLALTQTDYSYVQVKTACDTLPFIVQESHENKIDPGLIISMIKAESAWSANLVGANAECGLMQISPTSTPVPSGRVYSCAQLKDPYENIRAGIEIIKYWIDMADGNVTLAICAYDAGFSCFEEMRYDYVEKVATEYEKLIVATSNLGGIR